MLLTSPSVATVGMSLTVPLAILSDLMLPKSWLVDPVTPTAVPLLSAAAVIGGFVAINLAPAGDGDGDGRGGEGCWRVGMRAPLLAGLGGAGASRGVDAVLPDTAAAGDSTDRA